MPGVLNLYIFKIQDRDKRERKSNVQLEMKKYIYLHEDQKYEASMGRFNIYV